MKLLTTTNGIRIALFATFLLLSGLNLFAQYKLDLEWQKEPGVGSIRGLAISSNDSIIIVSGDRIDGNGGYIGTIMKIKTRTGEVVGGKDTIKAFNYIKILKDGQTMICASESNGTFGMYDYETFEQKFSIGFPKTMWGFNFCEPQMKAIASGQGLIRVYDITTKEIIKEFSSSYFNSPEAIVSNVAISDDGKYIFYSYSITVESPKGTFTQHNYLKMIDLEGKIIKEFNETSSPKFTFTIDGKTLIYFMPDAIHFFDLESMKEKEGIVYNSSIFNNIPLGIEVSNDGKFMLLGLQNGLIYCDFETKKTFNARDFGTWRNFKLNNDNSSLFATLSNTLYKFNKSTTNIDDYQVNKLELTIQVMENNLILKSDNGFNQQIKFRIISSNGKTQEQITPNKIQFSQNSIVIDISSLLTGAYIIEITDNQSVVFSSKFIKTN